MELENNKAMALAGPQADCVNFGEYVARNVALNELRNEVQMTTKATASFVRGEVNCPTIIAAHSLIVR